MVHRETTVGHRVYPGGSSWRLEESVMVTFASRVTSLERGRYSTPAIGNWNLEFHGCFDFQCAPRAIVISLFHMSTHNSYRDIQHNTFSTISS